MSLCPLGTSPAVAPFVGGPERQNQSPLPRSKSRRRGGAAASFLQLHFSFSSRSHHPGQHPRGRSWLAPLPSSFIATSASSPTSTPARPRRPSGSSSTPASTTRWARSMTARRPWTGWSRSRSAASPSPRRRPRPSGRARPSSSRTAIASTSSTPRPRRLHHRGGALAARARWRGGGVQRRRRSRAAVRDGLAPGQQVPCAAPGLRQQNGSPGRRFPPRGRADQATPGPCPGADPTGDRRGGKLQRADRPGEDEGHLLERCRPGHQLPRGGDPGGAAGAGRGVAGAHGRGRRRGQRRTDEQVSGRRGTEHRGDQGRAAPADPGQPDRTGGARLLVQEQGRAAGARRGDRLSPGSVGNPGDQGHRPGRRREARRAPCGRRRAFLGAGVQDRHRPLRRHPDLSPACIPGC